MPHSVGETLIREGDLGETAFIVHEGQVEIRKDIGGKIVPLATAGPGDTIGEMSMIDDTPRSATAVALTPVVADEVHHDDFYQALQTDREVALIMLKALFERRFGAVELEELVVERLRLRPAPTGDASEAWTGLVLEDARGEAAARIGFAPGEAPRLDAPRLDADLRRVSTVEDDR